MTDITRRSSEKATPGDEVAVDVIVAGGGLQVTLAEGSSRQARRVLVATGLVDEYPDLPGLRERWGRDVVHCPQCLGWDIGHQVQADATGLTAAPGVWVGGNAADVTAGVMQAATSGVTAAVAISADLTAEDTAAALAAREADAAARTGRGAQPRQQAQDLGLVR